jgi:hypothetical protein
MRSVTTAPGVHPVDISASAKLPDVPNAAADVTASPSPTARRRPL